MTTLKALDTAAGHVFAIWYYMAGKIVLSAVALTLVLIATVALGNWYVWSGTVIQVTPGAPVYGVAYGLAFLSWVFLGFVALVFYAAFTEKR